MLKEKALKKILISTIALFTFLLVYLIGNIQPEKTLEASLELEYVTGLGTNYIYLLNKDNYLVKTKVLITQNSIEEKAKEIIENLIIDSKKIFPNELKGILPKGTKVLDIYYDEEYITINFSKEILNTSSTLEEKILESITYSICSLKKVKGIYIQVEGKPLLKYPNSKKKISYPLTKQIGINKEYNIDRRENINKVVVYYLTDINNENYYIPVTKYLNSSNDKIKVIIDSLTTSYIYEPNLMSFLNTNVKLNEYNIEDNIFFLDFNKALYDSNNKVLEEVIYSISYSVFDNYDVDSIIFRVDNKDIKTINNRDLP